ncbi:unnamed protein product [Prorocentrum cordatum]|uniref:SPRY domain-containing protein 7 n=1 Tax=Prorocentrum cordatum TaxID=2364126 RepID=A0ABN9VMJ7_9DINO|nr:unnamed protein product [Polarella glacialis]
MASSVTVYSIAQSIQQPGLLEKDNLARYRVNLPRRCQVGYRGALCCCCPPRSESDEEAPLVASPGVHIGKRGTHVEVAGQGRGILVRGEGSALADTVIEQDAAYWEVRVLDLGAECHIGVAYELSGHLLDSQLGDRSCSWTLSQELHRGDVIGVAFGQGDIPNLRRAPSQERAPPPDMRNYCVLQKWAAVGRRHGVPRPRGGLSGRERLRRRRAASRVRRKGLRARAPWQALRGPAPAQDDVSEPLE